MKENRSEWRTLGCAGFACIFQVLSETVFAHIVPVSKENGMSGAPYSACGEMTMRDKQGRIKNWKSTEKERKRENEKTFRRKKQKLREWRGKRVKGRRKINNKDNGKQMSTSITVTFFQTKFVLSLGPRKQFFCHFSSILAQSGGNFCKQYCKKHLRMY